MSEPTVQELILDQLKTITEKVDHCTVTVAQLSERVDGHAVTQSREHAEVKRRVGALEVETASLGKTTSSMKVKIGLLGVALGAAVSEGMKRFFHG